MPDIFEIIGGGKGAEGINRDKVYGVAVAVVTSNKDPNNLYQVRVRYVWDQVGGKTDTQSSFWARIATFGAGKDRGMFNLPQEGDEVVVAFEHGERDHPIVIGSLWNKDNPSHLDHTSEGKGDGTNHLRRFKSRSGHYLEFNDNDKDKKESVTIKTKAGHIFMLDDSDGALLCKLYDKDNVNTLLFDTTNKKIELKTEGEMLIQSKKKMTIKTEDELLVESTKDTNMKAQNWTTTAKSNFELKASGGTGTVESSGTMTVKGSMVNIN